MICKVFGERLKFIGRNLEVADSQRVEVEDVLQNCSYEADWAPSVSQVEEYKGSGFGRSEGVAIWTMSLRQPEGVAVVQSALDLIDS